MFSTWNVASVNPDKPMKTSQVKGTVGIMEKGRKEEGKGGRKERQDEKEKTLERSLELATSKRSICPLTCQSTFLLTSFCVPTFYSSPGNTAENKHGAHKLVRERHNILILL